MSAVWLHKVDLSDVFHDDARQVQDKAVVIAERFRAKFPNDAEIDYLMADLIDASETDGIPGFDEVWDNVYDWADSERVWVRTR